MSDRWTGWPDPEDLPTPPERLIYHWTAGGYRATDHETLRYHVLVEHHEGDPEDPTDDRVRAVQGVPVPRNCGQVSAPAAHDAPDGEGYAAHVRLFNSGSIGVAACAMRGAIDHRPDGAVDPGPSPLTRQQVTAMIKLGVTFCATYGYRPIPDRVMTHYEVEALHGVDQRDKWNVTWVPALDLGRDEVGPWLRGEIADALDGKTWAEEMKIEGGEDSRSQVEEMGG